MMIKKKARLFVRTTTDGEYVGEFNECISKEWMVLSNVIRSRPDVCNDNAFVYPLIKFKVKNVAEVSFIEDSKAANGGRLESLLHILSSVEKGRELMEKCSNAKKDGKTQKGSRIEDLARKLNVEDCYRSTCTRIEKDARLVLRTEPRGRHI